MIVVHWCLRCRVSEQSSLRLIKLDGVIIDEIHVDEVVEAIADPQPDHEQPAAVPALHQHHQQQQHDEVLRENDVQAAAQEVVNRVIQMSLETVMQDSYLMPEERQEQPAFVRIIYNNTANVDIVSCNFVLCTFLDSNVTRICCSKPKDLQEAKF